MKRYILIIIFSLPLCLWSQIRKLTVEPNHSTIGFNISIAGFTQVTGKFTDYELNLDWNESSMDSSKISTVIKVKSIDTGIPDRDAHLRTADFFDEEKYPHITFESDSILQIDYSNFKAFGKFTMHGVTKDFVFPFQIVKIENNTVGIRSRTTLNRQDYGVGSEFKHSAMPDFLSDIIEVEIDFWTRKRKE
ncbi:MAG: YceI family protein [Flavobacteriaceae bacterium]|nr:YceI family protein [Muriicola sp.]MBT8290667.1 YceI family protein [Muriicola sp.]NNK35865.1 YceI family protein [Eudoraea sp.]NNL38992.1 YceI family protein [Flavobacteriaceae bacterium]